MVELEPDKQEVPIIKHTLSCIHNIKIGKKDKEEKALIKLFFIYIWNNHNVLTQGIR
jgi:hypothetical protein